jgi:hypothetical protein
MKHQTLYFLQKPTTTVTVHQEELALVHFQQEVLKVLINAYDLITLMEV